MNGQVNLERPLSSLPPMITCDAQNQIFTSISRDDQVQVWIKVVFIKIGDIDTVGEKFQGDVFIQARWREPSLDGNGKNTEYELSNPKTQWNPLLYVENTSGSFKETVWYLVSFNRKGEATIYQRRRIKGYFNETMELEQYPFDTQDLTITLTSERGEADIRLDVDFSEACDSSVQSFLDEQEWILHRHLTRHHHATTNAYSNMRHKHPALSVAIKASRRTGFFIWNIMLIMFFICTLIFTTFTVDVEKPENRLQLSFILLLSNITFKFTVNSTKPKVSYLTYLDKYILVSMVILCMVCVWHAIISQVSNQFGRAVASFADNIGFAILFSTYLIFNISFFAAVRILVYKKHKELDCKGSLDDGQYDNRNFKNTQVFPV